MTRHFARSVLLPVAFVLAGCSSNAGTPSADTAVATPPAPSPVATTSSPPPTAAQKPQAAVGVESNPPGDIPDNLAFVVYRNAVGRYSFTHPEGWAETARGSGVTFTDKLNGVQVQLGKATATPTVETAKRDDVPALARDQAAFELRRIGAVTVPFGSGVRIVYRRNSAPDAVTGRQYRDEVERYEVVADGREVVMELFGPVGSDNVDAYRTMIQSLRTS